MGVMAAVLPSLLAIAGAVTLACGGKLNILTTLLAMAGTAAAGWRFAGKEQRKRALACFGLLLLFVGLASWCVYDLSYDGQAYHQEAVIQLAGGWNPYGDAPLQEDTKNPPWVWINHYAKGPWLAAAAIYAATGFIEMGKAINLLALAASGLLSYIVLREKLSARVSGIGAALIAFNPVSLNQVFTYGNDGLISSLMIVLAALLALAYWKSRAMLIPATLVVLLLVNIKFTAVGYAGLICALYVITLMLGRKKRVVPVVVLALAGGVGLGVLGYNPYVTNWLDHGHPFHPLAGSEKVDIIRSNMLPAYVDLPVWEKTALSWFGESSNRFGEYPRLKVPFAVLPSELAAMAGGDTRIGGFGPWFGGTLLLSAVLLAAGWRGMNRSAKRAFLLFMAGLLALIFVNPEPWWARYVPHAWLLPLAVWLWMMAGERLGSFGMRLRSMLILAITVNALLATLPTVGYTAYQNTALRSELGALRQQVQVSGEHAAIEVMYRNMASNRVRLEEAGIRTKVTTLDGCASQVVLTSSDTVYCKP